MYFQKARELGELILESDQYMQLADARAEYENSPEAQKMMEDYMTYQNKIRENTMQGLLTKEEIQKSSQRLSEMITELKQDPVAGALIFAENEYNKLVNQVTGIIRLTINGESSCGSDCGTCGGCNK